MNNVKDENIYEVVIFHHNDADGYGSAAVLKLFHVDAHIDNIKCVSCKHGTPIDPDIKRNINEYTTVYVVDYSFSNEQDQKLLKEIGEIVDNDIYWIDHHASSEELLKDDVFKVWAYNGLVRPDNAWAAIGLTYYWCTKVFNEDIPFNITSMHKVQSMEDIEEIMEDAPMWVRYIDDYDKWAHKLNPETDYFISGLGMESLTELFINDYTRLNSAIDIDNIIKRGTIISKFRSKQNDITMRNAFECNLKHNDNTYKILCCNASGNSKLFGNLIEAYDAVISFTFDGKMWTHSMFSKADSIIPSCGDICAILGKRLGTTGGGHAHAAGFTSYDLVFTKNSTIIVD